MPFIYALVPAPATPQATSATGNTEIDAAFLLKPGARNQALQSLYVVGRGVGLTAISGLTFRVKKWFTTASVIGGGVAITPAPRDVGMQAAKGTSAYGGTGVAAVTSGTGGPTLMLSIGCGAAGPGGWVAPNPDSVHVIEGAATQTLDLFVSSGTASLNYEWSAEIVE